MGLSRIVYEIDGNFSRKAQNFPTPLYFAPPLKGVPLGIGYRVSTPGSQNYNDGLPDRQRNLTISSAVWIQCTTVTDGQTNR